MLFIGMGTEVVVFFLSAFDRPFDKDEIGKELPRDYETDDEIAAKLGIDTDDDDDTESHAIQQPNTTTVAQQPVATSSAVVQPTSAPQFVNTAATTEQTPQAPQAAPATESAAQATTTNSVQYSTTAAQAAQAAIDAATPAGAAPFDAEAKRLAEIIRLANDELLHRAQAALSPEMEEATQEYIDKLRTLAETFKKVDEQSARLAHDSEEMSNLNRTLTAINKTYDLHFQSISKQVGTIEQINDETRQLAKRIKELNAVYGRMIEALSVNIPQTSNKE